MTTLSRWMPDLAEREARLHEDAYEMFKCKLVGVEGADREQAARTLAGKVVQ